MFLGVLVLALPFLAWTQDVTITTQDPRMHFQGTWVVQDSGGHEFTATIGSSVSLIFPGTAIYWHATINPRCGIASVSVDGGSATLIDASAGTTSTDNPIPAILFSQTELQPGVSHTISITLFAHGSLGGPYMEMYNLSYIQDNSVTAASTASGVVASIQVSTSVSTNINPSTTRDTRSSTPVISPIVIIPTASSSSNFNHSSRNTISGSSSHGSSYDAKPSLSFITIFSLSPSSSSTTSTFHSQADKPATVPIIGGAVGGAIGALLVFALALFFLRRKRLREPPASPYTVYNVQQPDDFRITSKSVLVGSTQQTSQGSLLAPDRTTNHVETHSLSLLPSSSATPLTPTTNELVSEDPPPPYIPQRSGTPQS